VFASNTKISFLAKCCIHFWASRSRVGLQPSAEQINALPAHTSDEYEKVRPTRQTDFGHQTFQATDGTCTDLTRANKITHAPTPPTQITVPRQTHSAKYTATKSGLVASHNIWSENASGILLHLTACTDYWLPGKTDPWRVEWVVKLLLLLTYSHCHHPH